jgi:DNA-binding YbaB/EbfC family protein
MNMQQMMKQAQKMQKDMESAQAEIEAKTFEATAGGVVKVIAKGNKVIQSIEINEDLLNPEDKSEVQELVMMAVNNVLGDIDRETSETMSSFTSGMNLPF